MKTREKAEDEAKFFEGIIAQWWKQIQENSHKGNINREKEQEFFKVLN